MRDVMVFCPVLRLEAATIQGLFELEWDGPLTVVWQRDNPERIPAEASTPEEPEERNSVSGRNRVSEEAGGDAGTRYRNHLHQYQRGRELFLAGRFEAMLVVESDIVPPPDTLRRLAALEADVGYGVYLSRSSHEVNVLELYYDGKPRARNIGEPLSSRGLWAAAVKQGIVECSGGGLGCLLITRKVLEAVPFEAFEGGRSWFDNAWTEGVYRAGFTMRADTAVACGHVDVDGTVLWPEERPVADRARAKNGQRMPTGTSGKRINEWDHS